MNVDCNVAASAVGDQVYGYLVTYHGEHGYMPTIREIMDGVGLSSTSLTTTWLDRLEHAGRIRRTSRAARSIVLVESPKAVVP